jgi:hypothetical protein
MIIEDPEQTYQLTIDIEAMRAYNKSWGTTDTKGSEINNGMERKYDNK